MAEDEGFAKEAPHDLGAGGGGASSRRHGNRVCSVKREIWRPEKEKMNGFLPFFCCRGWGESHSRDRSSKRNCSVPKSKKLVLAEGSFSMLRST